MRASFLIGAVCMACAPAVDFVEQAQVPTEPDLQFREFVLELSAPSPIELGRIQVVGERAPRGLEPNTEYWFVNRAALPYLGRYPLDVYLSYEGDTDPPDPDYTADPPEPDNEADPPQPDLWMQTFSQPVYPEGGWGEGWLRDPIAGGVLYSGPLYSLRLFAGPEGIERVVWYQVIDASSEAHHQEPDGLYRVGAGVVVPRGSLGYLIDQSCQ